jgi:phosphotransferase system, enzyme I, PtsP
MFPMVSEPWEFDEAKTLFEAQLAFLAGRKKQLPSRIRYGAMLEVPALAETLDILLPKLDFLSIGTNDLTQFLFAADRADPRLAERYEWLSPAMLRFIRRVVIACKEHKVDLAVCGEMGGRPMEALALIGIGLERLSITPAAVGAIKAMVRSANAEAIAAKMEELLASPPQSMRKALSEWALEQAIEC